MMVLKIKRTMKVILSPVAKRILIGGWSGRTLTTFPDDTFIVSYPKSGNTWTRFLIGNMLFQDETINFANLEQKIPNVNMLPDRHLLKVPRPRFFKSHEYFVPSYKRVIFIVRDPREVAVSYYHHNVKRGFLEEGYEWDRYVDRFVGGDLDSYGSWYEHVGSWLGARSCDPDFLLLHYEDMLNAPENALRRIANHLGMEVSDNRISHAVANSSFDHMRQLEKKQEDIWYFTKSSKKNMNFVRSGKRESWKEILTETQVNKIETPWAELMKRLGYLL